MSLQHTVAARSSFALALLFLLFLFSFASIAARSSNFNILNARVVGARAFVYIILAEEPVHGSEILPVVRLIIILLSVKTRRSAFGESLSARNRLFQASINGGAREEMVMQSPCS